MFSLDATERSNLGDCNSIDVEFIARRIFSRVIINRANSKPSIFGKLLASSLSLTLPKWESRELNFHYVGTSRLCLIWPPVSLVKRVAMLNGYFRYLMHQLLTTGHTAHHLATSKDCWTVAILHRDKGTGQLLMREQHPIDSPVHIWGIESEEDWVARLRFCNELFKGYKKLLK